MDEWVLSTAKYECSLFSMPKSQINCVNKAGSHRNIFIQTQITSWPYEMTQSIFHYSDTWAPCIKSPKHCLPNNQFGLRVQETSLAQCEGTPPVTGGFPSQRASDAEIVRFNVMTSGWMSSYFTPGPYVYILTSWYSLCRMGFVPVCRVQGAGETAPDNK